MRDLHRRLARVELAHAARVQAQARHSEPRRWVLLNLYVRSAGNVDLEPWRARLAALPSLEPEPRHLVPVGDFERRSRVLALLAREARRSQPYRELLGVALKAGFASERQARWIAEQGLCDPGPGQGEGQP